MSVIAIFKYQVEPGRMADFMAKLQEAGSPKFSSKVMPKSFRLFRSTVPGPDTGPVIMMMNMTTWLRMARTAYENSNPEWKKLFEAKADSPETLISVELLTEMTT